MGSGGGGQLAVMFARSGELPRHVRYGSGCRKNYGEVMSFWRLWNLYHRRLDVLPEHTAGSWLSERFAEGQKAVGR